MTRVVRTLTVVTALTAASWLSASPAQAAPIGISYTMNLSVIAGADTLGLHGATASLTIMFDTADIYANVFGLPAIVATSDTLTISGASVPASNGTFSSNAGIRFFPTFGGQYFGGGGDFATYTVGAVPLVLGRLTDATVGAAIGDPIEFADFGLTPFTTAQNPGCNWCATTDTTLGQAITDSRYGVTNFTATPVPEPATLTLVGLGVAGLVRSRRRRA